ncbi:MAG: MATE family efflux transporter [Maricaulaceae bacterium]
MAGTSKRDLTEGSAPGHLLRLAWPMSLGIAAFLSVNLVDTFFIAQLGEAQLAAVAFCFPVVMSVSSLSIGLGAGAVSVVARAAGAGDRAKVRALSTDAFLLTVVLVALISAVGFLTIEPLFRFLRAGDTLMPYIRDYMQIWFAGTLFLMAPMVANNLLRALGDSLAPSLIMIGGAAVNLILDPVFIFGWGAFPRLEVQGAALATLIANGVSLVFAGFLVFGRERLLSLEARSWADRLASWRSVARVGLPAAGSNAANPIAMTAATAGVAYAGEQFGPGQGALAVAGFGVATRLEFFAAVPLLALSAAIGPLTGQNGGAGRTERVRQAFLSCFGFAAGWSVLVALAFWGFGEGLARQFSDAERTLTVAGLYLALVPVTLAGYGVVITASAGFNALGRPWPGLAMTLSRSFVLYAPGVWIGGTIAGPVGAFAGVALANVLAGLGALAWTLRADMTARR